ncbi:MAG: BadF/BadG/BcrA/BcrD ATPase family protein [Chloroflexota bacterium]
MSAYFLGVDVGGTKSHALVANAAGDVLGFGESGPGNHESVGYDGLFKVLSEAMSEAFAQAGITAQDVSGAGFGLSGCDWPKDVAPLRRVVDGLHLGGPFVVTNDATIALVAGAEAGWGVAIIAGTGCNCRGRDAQGREGRVTGEGGLFGEYGGASELVVRAIQAVGMAYTHRGPATRLTQLFMDYYQASDLEDLLEGLARRRYRPNPAAAPLVFKVAEEGDPVAREAIAWAGRQLGSLAEGVIRQLQLENETFEVVLAGSLFKGGPMLIEPLREVVQAIAPGARLVRLNAPPVVGAVLLGMEQAGVKWSSEVRQHLIDGAREALEMRRAARQS